MGKKTIAISIPCWNEEGNIVQLVKEIELQFEQYLCNYDYLIQFIDNCSTDSTRKILEKLCKTDTHIRAIYNVSNVPGSAIHGILQTEGDCCIHMACDFQDPPSLIPQLVNAWEAGAHIVCAIKTSSEEKKIMWKVRSLYYKIMSKFSVIPQIEHFTGFGLYDREFVEIIRRIEDPLITLRGLVAEYGHGVEKIYFKQPIRKKGKSGKNFIRNYDYAVRNFTTYTKIGIHISTFLGIIGTSLSLLALLILLIFSCINNNKLDLSIYIVVAVIFLVGSIQLGFIGLIGSYIINMNVRLMKRPLAIEARRIGFDDLSQPKAENSSPYIGYEPTDN